MIRTLCFLVLWSICVTGFAQVIARDADGNPIGLVSGQEQWTFSIVTPAQFTVRIRTESGDIQSDFVYFLQQDCLGTPYLAQTYSNAVIKNGADYWYGNGNAVQDVEFLSYFHPNFPGCTNQIVPEPTGIEAMPNDPGVTGVPNGPFAAPFRIEDGSGAIRSCIFDDGFECLVE